ncbi:MAG: holo-ACP synthase [Anaerolineales bacterium]|nr:holo-ACP synthase [Anaerolineales bacterium]
MELVSGIDLIEIERLGGALQRHGERLLQRIYTPQEILDCQGRLPSLAARFAAKEAVAKALGTGIGLVGWREIEIRLGELGQPVLHLHGAAAERAMALGLANWSISLSHSQDHAIALAVACGRI